MALKQGLKKFWNFIWNDNSIWSWIISLILAFIIVKFIFFPLLSLAFQSQLPLVVVESGSMHHPGNIFGNIFSTQNSFNAWWQEKRAWYEERNITKTQAENWKLRTGFEIGDIMIVSGWNKNPKVGDVIIFSAPGYAYPIIHRIVSIIEINGQKFYSTKGDNNSDQLVVEKNIPESSIIGKAVFKIPRLGWIKLFFVKLFS
jgi:signal peptidase I